MSIEQCEERLKNNLGKNPIVSVIVPNLNKRRFLPECFESIQQQTFTDWEVIFVDGFSEDDSWEFTTQFWGRDSKVHLYQRKRRGVYDAWNWGIQQSQGEYIYIATSDDTMYPECIETSVKMLQNYPEIDLAAFPIHFIDEDSKVIDGCYGNHPGIQFFQEVNNQVHIRPGLIMTFLHYIFGTLIISMTGILIRRSLFEKAGYFPEDIGTNGDREWMMHACLYTDVLWIPEILATLRIHESQASRHVSWEESNSWRIITDTRVKRRFEEKYPEYQSVIKDIDCLLIPSSYEIKRAQLCKENNLGLHKIFSITKLIIRYPLKCVRELTCWIKGDRLIHKERRKRGKLLLDKLGLPKVYLIRHQ